MTQDAPVFKTLSWSTHETVLILAFNRPEQRNALTGEM